MTHITLPHDDTTQRGVSFWLAAEEWLARSGEEGPFFLMWQVAPSVIFGRNQVMESEVNEAYCRREGISIYRRKSGGGCVYADQSNVMLSYVARDDGRSVAEVFGAYVGRVAEVLRQMGVPATASGRNDIMIGDRKVSGNAFYHVAGHYIAHGTLLYDTNMQHMVGAITPSDEKLVSKGVQSVRQHVALLRDYTALSLEEVKAFIAQRLCDSLRCLTPTEVEAIEVLEREYLEPAFVRGRRSHYTTVRHQRLEGVGEMELRLSVRGGVIEDLDLLGDYFVTGDVNEHILRPLRGVRLEREAILAALPPDVGSAILGLTRENLATLLEPLNHLNKTSL